MENYEYTRPNVNRNNNAKIRKLRRKKQKSEYMFMLTASLVNTYPEIDVQRMFLNL